MWSFSPPLSVQFLVYNDSVGSGSPMDMETDGPMLDDVNMLKKTVEEEATQVKECVKLNRQMFCRCTGAYTWFLNSVAVEIIANVTGLCSLETVCCLFVEFPAALSDV